MLNRDGMSFFWAELEKGIKRSLLFTTDGMGQVELAETELLNITQDLKENWGFFFLLDLSAMDLVDEAKRPRFQIIYELLNLEHYLRLRLIVKTDGKKVPSLKNLWPNSVGYEREALDLYGLSFDESEKKTRLLSSSNFIGHSGLKDFSHQKCVETKFAERSAFSLETFGPQNPQTEGPFLLKFNFHDEKISELDLEIGYAHKGIEKLLESKTFVQALPILERMDFCTGHFSSLAWCHMVETADGKTIPEKARALRMLFSELVRIYSHMSSLILIADEARLESMSWSLLREQERLSQLFAKFNGSRVLDGVYSIGGVAQDLPIGWGSLCQTTLKSIKKTIQSLSKQTTRSRQWMNRMGLSPLSAKQALDWGVTGPMLRACGVNYDLRKIIGHYFYKDIEFEIPLGINGDCYDRVLVKIEEIYQSSKICEQLIDNLPAGDFHLFDSQLAGQSDHPQQLIAKELRFSIGPNLKTGIHEASLEAPTGHLSLTAHVDSRNTATRVRLRTPGFPLSQLYPLLVRGLSLEQSMTALSSLHLRAAEVDR